MSAKNPLNQEMAKITGAKKPGKARQAHQEWSSSIIDVDAKGKAVTNYIQNCRADVNARWAEKLREGSATTTKGGKVPASFIGAVTMEYFKKLPEEEQEKWRVLAKDRSTAARTEWNAAMTADPVLEPATVQT